MVISPRWYLWHLSKDGSVRAKLLQLCLTVAAPGTVACQAPLSMEFFRPEYWSGLPCPPPGDLPDPGIEPASLASPVLAGVCVCVCMGVCVCFYQ